MRKFELLCGGQVTGNFEIDCPEDELPESYAILVRASGTEETFTFEQFGKTWSGVSVREVKEP